MTQLLMRRSDLEGLPAVSLPSGLTRQICIRPVRLELK